MRALFLFAVASLLTPFAFASDCQDQLFNFSPLALKAGPEWEAEKRKADERFLAWILNHSNLGQIGTKSSPVELEGVTNEIYKVDRIYDPQAEREAYFRSFAALPVGVTEEEAKKSSEIEFRILPSQAAHSVARYTYAAHQIAGLYKLDLIPYAHLIRVWVKTPKGPRLHLGVLSAPARGESLPNHKIQSTSDLWKMQEIQPHIRDFLALEFLLGNEDLVNLENLRWDEQTGRMISFDHDKAFSLKCKHHLRNEPLGRRLPDFYTSQFLYYLRFIGPEQLQAELSEILSPSELAALLGRRELMLRHSAGAH